VGYPTKPYERLWFEAETRRIVGSARPRWAVATEQRLRGDEILLYDRPALMDDKA
jgi:hypothetical protein